MSHDYAPSQDGRYSRDRSPPRNAFPGMHPSRSAAIAPTNEYPASPPGPHFSGENLHVSANVADSHRGRPFGGPGAPRGRGYSPRGDFRGGYRGREPIRPSRDPSPPSKRPWTDVNRDKDIRSPSLVQQDGQDFRDGSPREFDAGRGRRGYRDGPTTPRFMDFRQPPHLQGREGFVRGRGRFDGPPIGRGRGGHQDERGGPSRGRSRSPRSYRWERDAPREASRELFREPAKNFFREATQDTTRDMETNSDRRQSVDGKYADPYKGVHPSRRPSDFDRAQRDREERSRDAETYRRDQLASPALYRNASNTSLPPTPGSRGAPSPAFGSGERARQPADVQSEFRGNGPLDLDYGEGDSHHEKPSRRPPSQGDSQRTEPAALQSSPPRAPEVPAYGSIPSASNVWRAQPPSGPKAQANTGSSRLPSTLSNVDIGEIAPKAPKAQRMEKSAQASVSRIPNGPMMRNSQQAPRALAGKAQTPMAPTPVASMTRPNVSRMPQPTTSSQIEATSSRQVPSAPSGPKAMVKSEMPMPWTPGVPAGPSSKPGPGTPSTLPMATPSGPRASNASVNAAAAGVPSGPKAERFNQAQSSFRTPPGPSLSMHRQMPFRKPGVIPAKREVDGVLIGEASQSPKREAIEESNFATRSHAQSIDQPEQGLSKRQKVETPDNVAGGPSPPLEEPPRSHKPTRRRDLDFSDDEDDMNLALDPAEIAQHEEQFERDKARLEAQKINLSSRRLRGCTPIEQLSLLGRLAIQDLDELTYLIPPRQSSGKKSQAVETVEVQDSLSKLNVEANDLLHLPMERQPPPLSPSPIGTPELKALPFLVRAPLTPISDMEFYQENIKRQEMAERAINFQLQLQADAVTTEEEDLRAQYVTLYRHWRQRVQKLEHQRKQDEAANAELHEAAAEAGAEKSPIVNPTPEVRRRGGTEYDLQKAMEESLKLAQEQAQEEANRSSLPIRPDYDREALLPEMVAYAEATRPNFKDTTRLRDPRDAVVFFELIPPSDNFTKQEHDAVVQNYKEYPKKFGKIAQGLPGRTYKDCINHYYTTKWNGQYKTPRDKRKGKAAKGAKVRAAPGTQARPRASALISNLDDAKPDLYDGDEAAAPVVAVTESGRPKRAAAPNFKEKEPVEVAPVTTPAKRAGKSEGPTDGTGEKSARKTKAAARVGKPKTRPVAPARPPTLSPAPPPAERQTMDRIVVDPRDVEGANGLAQLSAGSMHMPLTRSIEPSSNLIDPHRHVMAPMSSEEAVGRGIVPTITSSYWSVHEVNQFPGLLQHYGTDWQSISHEMGTKSQVMVSASSGKKPAHGESPNNVIVDPSPQVKNYYSRMKSGRDRDRWEAMANEANVRRERGEVKGPPPASSTAAPPARRRTDRLQVPGPRTLAPSGEVIELEDDGPPDAAGVTTQPPNMSPMLASYQPPMTKPVQRHRRPSSSSQAPPHPSYPPSNTNAHHGQSIHMPAEVQDVFARDAGSAESQFLRTMERTPVMMPAEDPRRIRYHEPLNPSPGRQSVRPWERSSREELPPTYYQQPPQAPSLDSRSPDKSVRYADGPLLGVPQTRHQAVDRNVSDGLSRLGARDLSTQSQANSRPLLDHTTSTRPGAASYFDTTRHTTSAQRDPPRGSTSFLPGTLIGDPRDNHFPDHPRSAQPPKSEPRKTSNLAAILNAEPEERKPLKAFATPTAPIRTQTPPQYGPVSRASYELGLAPPQRPLSQPNRPEAITEAPGSVPLSYQAPSFMQPPSSSRQMTDSKPRESPLHASAFRINWPPQSTYSAQPPERANEAASPFGRRSSLKSVEEPRYGPSSSSTVVRDPPSDSPSTYRSFAPFQQQQNARLDPSPPPARAYAFGPPANSQSGESSISRIPGRQTSALEAHQYPLHQAQSLQRHHQHQHSGSMSSTTSYTDVHRHNQQEQPQQPMAPSILQPHGLFSTHQQRPSGPGNPFASSRPGLQSNVSALVHNAASPNAIPERREPRPSADWTQGVFGDRARELQRPDRDREREVSRSFLDQWNHDAHRKLQTTERGPPGEQERISERDRTMAQLEIEERERARNERSVADQWRRDEQRRQQDEQLHQQRYGPTGGVYARGRSPQ